MQDDFQIVNHHIEHDADIEAAPRIRREPRGLDETRRGEPLLQRRHHGIEPLDVSDLQHEPALLCDVAQFARLLRRLGEWLLDEHMLARFEQRLRDFKVRDRRRRDRRRIHERHKFLQRSHRLRAELRSHLAGDIFARVEDGGELCPRHLRENARVIFPHAARADDTETERG